MEYEAESRQPIQSRESTIRSFTEKACQSLLAFEPNPYQHCNPGSSQAISLFACPATTMATSSHILDIYLSCPRALALHIHSSSPTLRRAFFPDSCTLDQDHC